MNHYAILTFLLTITAFYVFLAIYILVHFLTLRTPSLVKTGDKGRREPVQDDSDTESSSRLW